MKLAVGIGTAIYDWEAFRSFAVEAERIGIDSIWSAEFTGHDAFTPLAFAAAHTRTIRLGTGVVTLGSRSPAMLAMNALAVASLSGGRLLLGLGANARPGVESWHAQTFHPASRNLVETTEIVRRIASGAPLEHAGKLYSLPKEGDPAMALEPGLSASFPIYFAALSPKSLEATGAVADGWVGGASFGPQLADAFWAPIRRGAAAAGRDLAGFDFMAPAFMPPSREAALANLRPFLADLIAGHGTSEGSHHSAVYDRAGYGELKRALGERFAAGEPREAAALVPEEIVFGRALAGSDAEVRDVLRGYRDCGVTTIQAWAAGLGAQLQQIARIKGLLDDVNAEAPAAVR